MKQSSERRAGAQTIARAITALKLAAACPEKGVRVTDLACVLGASKPTAHRILSALVTEGLLNQPTGSRRYRPGPMLFELGLAAAHPFNLSETCLPVLEKMTFDSGDTSFLFVRNGNDAVCIQRVMGHAAPQAPVLPIGSRQPLGVSAGGLALLSFLPGEERRTVLEKIEARIAAYGELRISTLCRLISRTRESGYAWIGNHAIPGTGAIGLPVLNEAGVGVAAVTLAASLSRMNDIHIARVLPLLKVAVQSTEHLLRP